MDTQQAPSLSHIKIVKLTVSIPQSRVRPEYGIPIDGIALAGRYPALLTRLLTILRLIAMNCRTVLSTISEC